ncbi:dolichyl-diphosphooligosaccharide--protein glycosyltransferase subunit MAGT1-like [Babylonia areolata]|uniref:dolichyl-diphosphooligosaccharide--protein glycosyltransferase subunit MAGT1-like n=1 Tax=Babylonia areolata TaxID=304850 RepID=UPI003FD44F5E
MSNKWYCCCLFEVFVLLAAPGSSPQRVDGKKILLEDKVRILTKWTQENGVIRMNGDKFTQYVKTAPRNYSIIVMLTALKAERQCGACKKASNEYQILANSWRYSQQYSNDLFFAMVDYDDGPDVFQSMKIRGIPDFKHFPAKGKRYKGDTMDNTKGEFTADSIAKWVEARTDIRIHVVRPINYAFLLAVVGVMGVLGIVLYCLRSVLHYIFNRNTCAFSVLSVIFTMISGHMWNQIRDPPFNFKDHRTGEMYYIHPNRGSQFIVESYLIMLIHCCMAVGFIMMNEINYLKRRWGKIILALAGLGCLVLFFNILLSIFKTKNSFYPRSAFGLLHSEDS